MKMIKLMPMAALFVASFAFADEAPVIDMGQSVGLASQPQTQSVTQNQLDQLQSLPMDQRVRRLESQMANIRTMNFPGQVAQLQQEVQKLNGQIQVQANTIKILTEQQKSFYQDLSQQVAQLKSGAMPVKTAAQMPVQTQIAAQPAGKNNIAEQMKAYDDAFTFVRTRKFGQASTALTDFIKNYPDSKYTANAHYWLGQIYFLQGQTQKAATEFDTVVTKFPKNDKVPDSLLKIGIIRQQAGDTAQAKQAFSQLIKQYPDTTAAQLAQRQLQQPTS